MPWLDSFSAAAAKIHENTPASADFHLICAISEGIMNNVSLMPVFCLPVSCTSPMNCDFFFLSDSFPRHHCALE